MNVHQCRVALRPRGPLEVFDLALTLLRVHPGRFLRLSAALVLPFVVLGALLSYPMDRGALTLAGLVVIHPFIHAPITVLAGRLLFAGDVRARDVVRELLRNPVRLFAAWWWQTAGLVVGLGCAGLGFLITSPATIYSAEAALLEGSGIARTLGRATRLATHNPGNAVAAMLAWALLTVWGALVGEGLGQSIVGFVFQLGAPFGMFPAQITPYMVAGSLLVQPLVALFKLLLYVDARTRVEGWDLQVGLRAARLGAQ